MSLIGLEVFTCFLYANARIQKFFPPGGGGSRRLFEYAGVQLYNVIKFKEIWILQGGGVKKQGDKMFKEQRSFYVWDIVQTKEARLMLEIHHD